jgi:hypothetical protein
MKLIKVFGVGVLLTALTGSVAIAKENVDGKSARGDTAVAPLPKGSTVADSVVVTPPAPAPAAPSVNVQPAPVAPVAVEPAQPTYVEPRKTVVREDGHNNYMATVAVSAIMGAVAGALVGGAIYYLSDNQTHPQRIGYWAAGGVLVGTGVGLVNVMVEENRADQVVASSHLPTDPAPTYRLALLNGRF